MTVKQTTRKVEFIMSINEIVNEIKRNMYIPKEMEKILSELSDEELRAVISELTNDEYDELKSKIKNKDLLRRMEAIRGSRCAKPSNRLSNRFGEGFQSSIRYPDKSDDDEPSP